MIDLLAVEKPKSKPATIRAASYEAAIETLFKRSPPDAKRTTLCPGVWPPAR
jgi:hypothetical protein